MAEKSSSGYQLLSRYRGELMGLAMLAVMLFHAYQLPLTALPLRALRQMGFAGVDVFLLLSGMGIACSLYRREGEPVGRYYLRRSPASAARLLAGGGTVHRSAGTGWAGSRFAALLESDHSVLLGQDPWRI